MLRFTRNGNQSMSKCWQKNNNKSNFNFKSMLIISDEISRSKKVIDIFQTIRVIYKIFFAEDKYHKVLILPFDGKPFRATIVLKCFEDIPC